MADWQAYSKPDSLTVRGPGDNQDSYEDYLDNLSKHKYVISPPGNGQDCYRTLESVYMGCYTFVEDTPTNYLTSLPVLRYQNIDDIISMYSYNKGAGPEMSEGFEERPEIKLSHWKELIHSKRNEIF